jgi:hypothetical protein
MELKNLKKIKAQKAPLQNLIHVPLDESPTKIEENCIFRAF